MFAVAFGWVEAAVVVYLREIVYPDGFDLPLRLIAPGESVALPEVHFGLNHAGFDDALQCWHAYLRRHVLYRISASPRSRSSQKRRTELIR